MSDRTALALALLALLLASACGERAKTPTTAPPPGEWRTFEGTGTVTGHRQTLPLGPDRKVSIFNLTGSTLIVGEQRLGEGFRSEAIGFADSAKGSMAWSVWTDSRGDQVFGELRGGPVGTGRRFSGTFLGGTGRYAGITGEYGFEWQFVIDEDAGTFQGRITGLRGRFRWAGQPPVSGQAGSRGEEGPGRGRR